MQENTVRCIKSKAKSSKVLEKSLLRRLQVQTLPNPTLPIGIIQPFIKTAVICESIHDAIFISFEINNALNMCNQVCSTTLTSFSEAVLCREMRFFALKSVDKNRSFELSKSTIQQFFRFFAIRGHPCDLGGVKFYGNP